MKLKKKKRYRHPLHGIYHGEFTWCLHCQCAYKTKKWVENDWFCPDKTCDGTALDAFPWSSDYWPRRENPEYPDMPEEGKFYPLYKR